MQLLQQYGDQLVCVRYRYDCVKQKRYKTVELIVEEKDWIPAAITRPDRPVKLRIGFNELELRSSGKRCWRLLGFEKESLGSIVSYGT